MKLLLLTSNALRHKYFANTLSDICEETMVISEVKKQDGSFDGDHANECEKHFESRHETEHQFFLGHETFRARTIPLLYGEVNSKVSLDMIKTFDPDLTMVFGASLIKDPLLSFLMKKPVINLHLGLSPYYRGSGTNFWPFVNQELEYVGATIHYLDKGIDTGDILCHVRPQFEQGDTVHTIGCKVIKSGIEKMEAILNQLISGKEIQAIPQWKTDEERVYRANDFDEAALRQYQTNLENNLISNYLEKQENQKIKLVSL